MVKKTVIFIAICTAFSFTGCNMRKNIDISISSNEETPSEIASYRLKTDRISEEETDEILSFCLDVKKEELSQYMDVERSTSGEESFSRLYEKDDEMASYLYSNRMGILAYTDDTDGRANAYELVMSVEFDGNYYDDELMRKRYPLEDIEGCSKSEALDACRPYAELLGYNDSEANVYAVTYEFLEEKAERYSDWGIYYGAPHKDYEEDSGGEKWSKDDEAITVVYTQKIDGVSLKGGFVGLRLIYVPKYEKVVFASGNQSYEIEEVLDKAKITGREQAVQEVILDCGLTSQDDIRIDGVTLCYRFDLRSMETVPCWNVLYSLKDDMGEFQKISSIKSINAIDGMVAD